MVSQRYENIYYDPILYCWMFLVFLLEYQRIDCDTYLFTHTERPSSSAIDSKYFHALEIIDFNHTLFPYLCVRNQGNKYSIQFSFSELSYSFDRVDSETRTPTLFTPSISRGQLTQYLRTMAALSGLVS